MEKFEEQLESLKGRAIAFIKQEVKNLEKPKRIVYGNNRIIAIFPGEQEVVIANPKDEITVPLKEFLEEDLSCMTVKRACRIADGLRE